MADRCYAVTQNGRKCGASTKSKTSKDGKCGTHSKKVWTSTLVEQRTYRGYILRSIQLDFWSADAAHYTEAQRLCDEHNDNDDSAITDAVGVIRMRAQQEHEIRRVPMALAAPAPPVPILPLPLPLPQGLGDFEQEFFGALLQQALAAPVAHIAAPAPHAVPPNQMVFTQDTQNIHRASVIVYVQDMMKRLSEVPVPPKQKTVGEILVALDLSDAAAHKVSDMYYHKDSIYEIEGAYKRALDPVWAYIKSHKERSELERRLQQELEDNIGMCAQGNLSRLINAVSGYLDGVAPPVSVGESLQNGFAVIAEKDIPLPKKLIEGRALLKKLDVPKAEWNTWLEAF